MSDEVHFDAVTGLTLDFYRFQLDGDVFLSDGASDETWGTGARDADSYDVSMAEDGSSGHYVGSFDTVPNIAVGRYKIAIRSRAGANPADTDVIYARGEILWSGTNEILAPNIILQTTIASVTTADTVFTLTASGLGLDDSTSDDARNGSIVSIEDATGTEIQSFKITDYVGLTKKVTIDKECTFPLAAGDIVRIYTDSYAPIAAEATVLPADITAITAGVWDASQSNYDSVGTMGWKQNRSDRHYRP